MRHPERRGENPQRGLRRALGQNPTATRRGNAGGESPLRRQPGSFRVRWKRDAHASAYRVQRSPEPITDTSAEDIGTVTQATYTGNGVIPGQRYWYRVAAVNRLGQGPWSMPALRPVL